MSKTQTALERIEELAAYEDGWYDGNGKAMSASSISEAKTFLAVVGGAPSIFPNEDGYIQFEYLTDDGLVCIEFNGNDDRGGEVWMFNV